MTPSLDRLEEMVRLVEAKSRARKLEGEVRAAAAALRETQESSRTALIRLREERPVLQRELEQLEIDEGKLRDLTKKVTQLIAASAIDETQRKLFMEHIQSSRVDLDHRRREAQGKLETIQKDATEARKRLQVAMEQFQTLRQEVDRIQPALAPEFQAEDRIVVSAEEYFTAGQIRALARETDAGAPHFGALSRGEQLAQLMVWIGRLKRLQSTDLSDVSEEDQETLRRIFPKLVGLSKQYEPGYIEAFRQTFTTDWDAYIARAEDMLRIATERTRADRDVEQKRREQQVRSELRQIETRKEADDAISELKALIASVHLPDEGVEQFQEAVAKVIGLAGAGDPVLLDLVAPHVELLGGADFRALRKHLERAQSDDDPETNTDEYEDLLELTRGLRALMIGGVAREESRRALERLFEFEELEWEHHEDNRPARLDSLEQRIRNRSVDVVLILREFVGHNVTERLRPASEDAGIPCLLVEHGYGFARIADTLRRGLMRSNFLRDDD